MRTIWQSLAWKEWHEHKWRLAALVCIVAVTAAVALYNGDVAHDALGGALVMAVLVAAPLAVFVAGGDAAGERARGTLAFLQALPVPLWRVALHKLAMGLITVILPGVALVGVLLMWHWTRSPLGFDGPVQSALLTPAPGSLTTGSTFVDLSIIVSSVAVSWYLWTLALGARRPDEISAGAWGLIGMVGWWLGLAVVALALKSVVDVERYPEFWKWCVALGTATAPLGRFVAGRPELTSGALAPLVVQIATLVALGVIFVLRFGATVNQGERSPAGAHRVRDRHDWLRPPWASPVLAIAWKQFRESGAVALTGLAGATGVVTMIVGANWLNRPRVGLSADDLLQIAVGVTIPIAVLASLVAGIGVALGDSGSRLGGFWRSRPISPDQWYWVKYGTGLVTVATALYLPLLVVAALVRMKQPELDPEVPWGVWLSLQLALFTSSLMLTCLVRQAIYAAILSIGVIYLGLVPANLYWRSDVPQPAIVVTFVLVAAISSIVGWLAMRNNWGRGLA